VDKERQQPGIEAAIGALEENFVDLLSEEFPVERVLGQ
jgi:hypothetical protein